MRLFTAIDLPDPLKEQLQALRQPINGVRWTDSNRYHLTLRFIGEADPATLKGLKDALGGIRAEPFDFEIKGPGYFPERARPRVLWAGVDAGPALVRLQAAVEQACRSEGLKADPREFKPHITLAKIKGARKKEILSFINQHKTFRTEPVSVSRFILYQSRLHADGAVHTPLERYELNATEGE